MERTLKVVQARHAIEAIMFGYAEAIDTGHIERIGTLLADCRLIMPDGLELKGGRQIAEHYSSIIIFYDDAENVVAYQGGSCTPRTKHVTTNLQFDFASDVRSAQVRSYFTVYQNVGGANPIIAGGRYIDRFDTTISGWRMTERAVLVDDRGDMSRHVRGR